MGLKSAFQGAAQAAIKAFSDVREEVTYRSWSGTTYNVETRKVVRTMTEKKIKGIWEDFTTDEVDNINVLARDRVFIVARKDLEAQFGSSFEVDAKDQIQRGSDERWEVVRIERDPADAAYVLQIRMGKEP